MTRSLTNSSGPTHEPTTCTNSNVPTKDMGTVSDSTNNKSIGRNTKNFDTTGVTRTESSELGYETYSKRALNESSIKRCSRMRFGTKVYRTRIGHERSKRNDTSSEKLPENFIQV